LLVRLEQQRLPAERLQAVHLQACANRRVGCHTRRIEHPAY
jgi:hypothetical protein